MFGVLKSCEVRRPLQTPTAQLQMPKIFSSPSMFVTWWTYPRSSACCNMVRASSRVILRALPVSSM